LTGYLEERTERHAEVKARFDEETAWREKQKEEEAFYQAMDLEQQEVNRLWE
jgi:hypothetical protein